MLRDCKLWDDFNQNQLQQEKMDYCKSLKLFEEMWREGVSLGVLPLQDPMEGIEVDLRIARILNHV